MHSDPPGPHHKDSSPAPGAAPFVATTTVHLIGGPLCGTQDYLIPVHCYRIELEDGTFYQVSSFASAAYDRETFIHSTLDPLIFAP